STVHKLRVLARNQQLIRLDSEQPLAAAAGPLLPIFDSGLDAADVVVLSDYAKGTLAAAAQMIERCRHERRPVLIDPKGNDFARYTGATVLTPNQSEFSDVVGGWRGEDEFLDKGAALRAELGLDALLVTRGERGMALFRRDGAPRLLDAEAREVFDVTGAGDTVIALMGAALAAGLPLEDAAELANLGAGLVVGKFGVASVSRAELRLALHRRGSGGRGLVTADELVELVTEAKRRGER